MKNLPKVINCRLKVSEDKDIMEDLGAVSDKTSRIKHIYRMGLWYEANKNGIIPTDTQKDIPTDTSAIRIIHIKQPLPRPLLHLPKP